MKNKKFSLIAIVFLLCAVVLQGVSMQVAYAEVKEIGLNKSGGSSNQGFLNSYTQFVLRSMDELNLVTGVKVNDTDYKETEEKDKDKAIKELSDGNKYYLYDRGWGEPNVCISKVTAGDIVKLVTKDGWLEIKIAKSLGFGEIHDKSSVKFVKKPAEPEEQKPEPKDPEEKTKVELKLRSDFGGRFYLEILPKPANDDVAGVYINGEPHDRVDFKYSAWNGGKKYYFKDGDLYLPPSIKNGDVIKLIYKDKSEHSFIYMEGKDGDILKEIENNDPGQGGQPNDPGQGNNPNNPGQGNQADVLPAVPLPENTKPEQEEPKSTDNIEKNAVTADTTDIVEDKVPEGKAETDMDDDMSSDDDISSDDMDDEYGKSVEAINDDVDSSNEAADIENDKVPLGKADLSDNKARLPRTGSVPVELYLIAGISLIVLGFKVRKHN